MRVVFMGSPGFALPSLRALAESPRYDVAGVFTQPDRPAGRGGKLTPPPVKQLALELRLPVEQPEKVRSDEAFARLEELAPEVIVVVGYGQIIPQRIIDLPRHGCVNVHSSLLPKYRGAAPVNWAIVRGETETGVCTMRIVKKLDAGDVLLCRKTTIGPDETAAELTDRLAPLGAELLLETLERAEAGTLMPQPQDEAAMTYAPLMQREDGRVDWSLPATEVYARVRGFDPWPGAFTSFRGKRLHIRRARMAEGSGQAGEILAVGESLTIACGGGGALAAVELQPEGKARMAAAAFCNGYQPRLGERLE
ncbi:MAG: methionyl-tRNA formyltransferase [Acidobacteria bacterium]|nr:methionyl-tRNA formyltransferase [Acidobacteriota bacterium]